MKSWPQQRLRAFAEVKHGFAFKSQFFCISSKYVLLTPGNFREEGGFRWLGAKQKFYSSDIPNGYVLKKDDLLIAMTEQAPGLLGSMILIPEDDRYLHNQRLGLLQINKPGVSRNFLYQVFNSLIVRRPISTTSAGTKVKHTSPAKIGNLYIPVPPIEQQTAIAGLLSTWDTAIEKTELLIAAKQQQRKGLMQQLLSGKRRVPGFAKPWQKARLDEVFTNRTESGSTGLPLVSITRSGGVVFRDGLERKDTSSADKSKYLRICPGDIGYNTMRMWQGVSGLSKIEGIVSPAYTIVTPDESLDPEFVALLFKYPPIVHLFYRYSQGLVSDTWNLKFRHFSEIRVRLPEKKEQEAIAAVFRPADKELDLLQQQLGAFKEQKKGLMQQLLTGKVRVKIAKKDVA